ncbi:hemopexin [Alligator mississippiensis]|uniref:hemopexin n=1 Tax=Alligator mississippiensis TaxID=8496 RepID=UPI00287796D3|nr:hemopexin [Alligator mississippiensis]
MRAPTVATAALCLAWALVLVPAFPQGRSSPGTGPPKKPGASHGSRCGDESLNDTDTLRRCADDGAFDAVTLDEKGRMLFFKGDEVWKGSHGRPEPINATWPELGSGPVDTAFRIHHKSSSVHDSLYLFQGEQVWVYTDGKLRSGYPRAIGDEFKGVPGHLDSAVECHPEECQAEGIIFFKGSDVYWYDLSAGQLKQRAWTQVGNCSAALRWLERYYCFQGLNFLRFNPVSGDVPAHRYPLDSRDYFICCPGRGHGHAAHHNATLHAPMDRCSGLPLQAFASDDKGRLYAFRKGYYFRLDSRRDGWHAWPLSHRWAGLEGEVDATFMWENFMYVIQGSKVFIYREDQGHALMQDYPKGLQEELGIPGADAAFTCPGSPLLYVIQGSSMQEVDLGNSQRVPKPAVPIPHSHVDSATCTADGVYLFHDAVFYHYPDAASLAGASAPAAPQITATVFFAC